MDVKGEIVSDMTQSISSNNNLYLTNGLILIILIGFLLQY